MKYELETQHFLWDQLLEPGTLIGDDTPYPIPDGFAPSASMKPLDQEAVDLSNRTGRDKQNWGRPEENLEIAPVKANPNVGTFAPNASTINRNNQPTIPPLLEQLTRPNDMRPSEGMSPRPNPLLDKALQEQNERMAAENDKRMADEANRQAALRTADSPNKPAGVTETIGRPAPETAPGQGPGAKPNAAQAPGQGPAKTTPAAKSGAPKPPAPPSNEVPRNTSGVVPESSDGKFDKGEDKKEGSDKK